MKTKDAQTIDTISMDDLARVIGGSDDDSGDVAFRFPRGFRWPWGKPSRRGGGGGLPIPGGGGNRAPDPQPGDNDSSES